MDFVMTLISMSWIIRFNFLLIDRGMLYKQNVGNRKIHTGWEKPFLWKKCSNWFLKIHYLLSIFSPKSVKKEFSNIIVIFYSLGFKIHQNYKRTKLNRFNVKFRYMVHCSLILFYLLDMSHGCLVNLRLYKYKNLSN